MSTQLSNGFMERQLQIAETTKPVRTFASMKRLARSKENSPPSEGSIPSRRLCNNPQTFHDTTCLRTSNTLQQQPLLQAQGVVFCQSQQSCFGVKSSLQQELLLSTLPSQEATNNHVSMSYGIKSFSASSIQKNQQDILGQHEVDADIEEYVQTSDAVQINNSSLQEWVCKNQWIYALQHDLVPDAFVADLTQPYERNTLGPSLANSAAWLAQDLQLHPDTQATCDAQPRAAHSSLESSNLVTANNQLRYHPGQTHNTDQEVSPMFDQNAWDGHQNALLGLMVSRDSTEHVSGIVTSLLSSWTCSLSRFERYSQLRCPGNAVLLPWRKTLHPPQISHMRSRCELGPEHKRRRVGMHVNSDFMQEEIDTKLDKRHLQINVSCQMSSVSSSLP